MFHSVIRKQRALTLIELLIVVAIIGILLQLALPAIEASREAARRTQCQSNLHQIGLATLHHEQSQGLYPSGGWGWQWIGDPDRGYGPKQPGSWIFNILSFVEQGDARSAGGGKSGLERSQAILQRCAIPLPLFVCPSRRLARSWPIADTRSTLTTNDDNKLPIKSVARSDYAINTGDFGTGQIVEQFPASLAEGDNPDFEWYDTSAFSGISYGHSIVRAKDVMDGFSKTYLIGEKFLATNHYTSGLHRGDNESMYSGFDNDNGRSTHVEPWRDRWRPEDAGRERFGSAHPSGWQAIFCDGSIRLLSFDLDLSVHQKLGNRGDGDLIDMNEL